MKPKFTFLCISLLCILIIFNFLDNKPNNQPHNIETKFFSYSLDSQNGSLQFVYKNKLNERYASIGKWKEALELNSKKLLFATNGGMYKPDHSPVGLYIENGKSITKIDRTKKGYGNFYLQPNGVLLVNDDGTSSIIKTQDYKPNLNIKWATQSGPMLLIDKEINSLFKEKSPNLHIRSGVGVLPNGKLIFAISKQKVTFHQCAKFFKSRGCVNALYLDGVISRMYLSEEKSPKQLDGNFGVIIGVVE